MKHLHASLTTLVALSGCYREGERQPAPIAVVVVQVPPTEERPSGVPIALAPGSILDAAPADAVDKDLPNPTMSGLVAVGKTEAMISLAATTRNDLNLAIVNLATGCIVATRVRTGVFDAIPNAGDDAAVIAYLQSLQYRENGAQSLADVVRFEVHNIGAVMTRVRSDGMRTVSADRQKIAVIVAGRVFFSNTGGKTFQRIAGTLGIGKVWHVYFGPDDRFLYIEFGGPGSATAIVDVSKPSAITQVDTTNFTPLRALSKEGKPLLAHQSNRCVHALDASTQSLTKLMCLQGAPLPSDRFFGPTISPSGSFGVYIDGWAQGKGVLFELDPAAKVRKLPSTFIPQLSQSDLQNFHFGPDDAGRFAWDSHLALRVATPEGIFENPWPTPSEAHTPLGFDLEGNVLWFHQPPLVGPHKPMTMMPPAQGKLGDSLCNLVSRTDPTRGKKILPAP
jgi:hypothetical protein